MKRPSQNLLESFKANLNEGFVVAYFSGADNGYVGREGDNYIVVDTKENAIKFNSEEEAKHEIENISQFFRGKAKLMAIKESEELKEDEDYDETDFYGGGVNEKVGGDYDEFIEELQNFRNTMNNHGECSTMLAQQIVEETIMEFDNIIRMYEQQKDIEIEGAMNECETPVKECDTNIKENEDKE